MRKILGFLFFMMALFSNAQKTVSPHVAYKNNDLTVESVEITDKATLVTVVTYGKSGGLFTEDKTISFSLATILSTTDGYNNFTLPLLGVYDGTNFLDFNKQYVLPGKKQLYRFEMIFPKIPNGCTSINIISSGLTWTGISINNPIKDKVVPHKNLNESDIKSNIMSSNNGFCGIYEGLDATGYKLACIKEKDDFFLIYMGDKIYNNRWKFGDVKAILRPSATNGLFKATWYMADKSKNEDAYLIFDGNSMKAYVADQEASYLKMYPNSQINNGQMPSGSIWTGTGFALNLGYIATNYHVVENAEKIEVYGIGGNITTKYNASVIATDRNNDLALIQIKDVNFKSFGDIPYRVKTTTSDVGEDVFVLGYPLITTMGNDIKLTTGIVSSKTGYMGDVALYQISAPIQPGNSGGPLFDSKGNLIGIVNAKHKGAENVGYAIKASYLNNLVESLMNSSSILPTNNKVSSMNLTNKVKNIEKYVFMIVCSN